MKTDSTQHSSSPVALVTGAAGDIGKTRAGALAGLGFRVAVADINPREAFLELSDKIGSPMTPFLIDVSDKASVRTVFEQVEQSVGPLSALVCCAATSK